MARIEQDELGELLSAYIDGELSAGEVSFVEKLLREDATARELLEELRLTVGMTASLPRHSAPTSLVSEVQAMLERSALLDDAPRETVRAHRERAPWAARLSMAAMVAIVIAGGWYFLQEPGSRRPSAPKSASRSEVAESKERFAEHRSRERTAPAESVAAADRRTVEEKLIAGVELAALRAHPFEAESVRLQVNVPASKDADALAERVTRKLADEKLTDLSSRTPAPLVADKGFFYRGAAGKNYKGANESQILVRATPTQIEQVLDEVAKAGQPDASATLVAGTLNVPGLQRSQAVLQTLSPSNATVSRQEAPAPAAKDAMAAAKKDSPKFDFVDRLAKIVGVDPALLAKTSEESDRDVSFERTTDEAASASKPGELARTRTEAVAAGSRGSLVDQNLTKLEGRAASPPPVDEPLVTMIIQLVAPPAPPPKPTSPTGRARDTQPVRNGTGRSTS